jgi:glycosyltransferase involved in cell wall biosynthesis
MPQTTRDHARGDVCIVVAARADDAHLDDCLESLRANTPEGVDVVRVDATTAAVNRALVRLAPGDAVVLSEPCRVSDGWLARLREGALEDTNTATASALVDVGGSLALGEEQPANMAAPGSELNSAARDFAQLTESLAARTLRLHPRLRRAVGPCVYVRREALELVGTLDERLELEAALEVDFAERCVLAGLAHVAADDVVVQRAVPMRAANVSRPDDRSPPTGGPPPRPDGPQSFAESPVLADRPALAESPVLAQALQAARGPDERLSVTLDARALDGALTGTQVHILELVRALARGGALRLRVLVWAERIDGETLALLRALPQTEILAVEDVTADTPRSGVFHRPQQAFSPGDVELAVTLGERVVLSQLDLIAYRNPGYFADTGSWEDFRRASRHGLAAAERVVVFSEHTRRELITDALVAEERVRVVPPGLDHQAAGEPRRPAALDAQLDDDGSHPVANDLAAEPRTRADVRADLGGFLLCLGTDFRHKNRLFALRLLAALRTEHGWRGKLVLAGTHIPNGSSAELERTFLTEHGELGKAIVALGAVDEDERAWLTAHADAVVYPSVYEGFGLVPFESALSGTPCVFAPQSSLAEAAPAGTATILPWDPMTSAATVHTLLTDDVARARHVQALATAARELTWAKAAASMVEIYREAAAAPVREAATLSRDAVARERELTASHAATVQTLIDERELVLSDYDELLAAVGPARSLVGPRGALPEDLQRGLLALSARPTLSRPLYGSMARLYTLARALGRTLRAPLRRGH